MIHRRATQQRFGVTIMKPGPPPILSKTNRRRPPDVDRRDAASGSPVTRQRVLSKAKEAYRVLYSPAR